MAKRNGGIIGPSNVPNPFIAKGVWKLRDAFNYIKAGLWPSPLGYQVNNSLRFNPGSSDNLTRTPSSTGNRKTWTYSTWFKKAGTGVQRNIFGTDGGNNNTWLQLLFANTDQLVVQQYTGDILLTTQVFRDVSAWYHIVLAFDNTQATSTNRTKLYVNGSQITAFNTASYQSQNFDTGINLSGQTNYIGREGGNYFSGYMAETYLIDGQQLTPSSFGQTDSATGIWTPKAYTGSYGTNGFYLKFANSAALGTDTSGNGNTFTVNNLTSVDQSTDTPTNNFATFNPLIRSYASQSYTLTDGNLQATDSSTGGGWGLSTIATTSGKWYWEGKVTAVAKLFGIGWTTLSNIVFGYHGCYLSNGSVVDASGNTATTFATYTTNDIIGVAVDISAGKVWFSKNGTFLGSGNPVAGTSPAFTFTGSSESGATFCIDNSAGTSGVACNFGSPTYAANNYTDAGGFGNFSYQPPSGYYALCTRTLAAFG